MVAGVAYAGTKSYVKMEGFLVMTPLNLVVSYVPREASAWACVGVLLLHAAESGLMVCLRAPPGASLVRDQSYSGDGGGYHRRLRRSSNSIRYLARTGGQGCWYTVWVQR